MRDCDAFISYSHRADHFRAAALQRALQNLGRPFYRRKNLNVFRDETSLSSNPGLWPSIERALNRSRYFVLMASPESAASPWCVREVEWWLTNRSIDTFLIVVTGGDLVFDNSAGDFDWTRTTALPPTLKGKFPVEPFYRDLRWAQREDNNLALTDTRFRAEVLPLAAALHGIEPQELDGEDLRQFQRNRRFWRGAAAALAVLTIVSAVAAWMAIAKSREATHQRGVAIDAQKQAERDRDAAVRAQQAESRALVEQTRARKAEEAQRRLAEAAEQEAVRQRDEAIRQRNVAFARQLAIKAEFLQKDKAGLLTQSVLLAAESLRRSPSLEADRTLRRGLALLPRQVAEAHYRPYLNDQGLSAVSGGRLAFMTVPDGELRVVAVSSEGFQDLARWTPDARVLHLTFDKIGGNLAIAGKGVFFWDPGAGPPRKVLDCDAVTAALHANLLAAGCEGEPLRFVDVATGKITESNDDETRDITGMTFTSDGTRLAAAHANGTLTMWQVEPLKQLFRTTDKHNGGIHATTLVAFDSFDDVVTKASPSDKMIRVYDANDGHVISTLNHPDIVLALDITPRGGLVATAGADGTARVFDGATGGLITELRHQAPVRDVHFAEWDGIRVVVTAGEDHTARVWRIDGGREIARATAAAPIGVAAPQYYTNHIAALSYDGVLRLWNMEAGEEQAVEGEMVPSLTAVWSEAQKAFAIAYSHWHAKRIDPDKKRGDGYFGEGEGRMSAKAAVWSADGRFVLWGTHERTQVWDAIAQRKLANVQHPYASAWALSADGRTFAVEDSSTLRVYRTGRETPLLAVKAGVLSTRSIAVSATHVASIVDNEIVIRSLGHPASKPITIRRVVPDRLQFSPDGRSITWDGYRPGVFDVQAQREIALRGAEERGADTMAFAADGQRIALAGNGYVGIWSLPSGNRLASLALESKSASMAFARDGRTLAVGGHDGTARIWRIEDGAELARIAIPAPSPGAEPPPITATALSGNGDYLLTTTAHSTRVWVVDSDHLIAQACRRLPDGLTAAEWRDYVGAESYRLTCGVYLRK